MTGKLLGNRYRLVELIGEGGMALVYKAECSLLCRMVAIKVLRPQYASDVEFVERFRREARAAASLSHPNVVNIYDVGQENGMDYIVMEYIPGNNLKDIIKHEAPLPTERALEITRQIAEALNHAHQRNIIHRDIKPHNILVTPDGQIKVTDFGIARAISASSFTQTGVVVGSVQYSSPEQAKGGVVGPQSDLYSLGCVLYELLTGRVPFKGDTPVSIALQHLQGNLIPAREIRPDLSLAVEMILQKAMAKEPSDRYPSALAMLKDIAAVQFRSSHDTVRLDETDFPTQAWNQVAGKDVPQKSEKGWRKWVLMGSVIFVLIGVILITIAVFNIFINPTRPEVLVPNLVGKEVSKARLILQQNKLKLKIINRLFSSEFPVDTVISQKPVFGLEKRINSEIEVVISRGPQLVKVPNLIGKTQLEVELMLDEAGLKLGDVLSDSSPDRPEGTVIKQLPEKSTQIERGASVSITLNNVYGNLVQVPNFIGRPLSEVRAELGTLQLVYNQATPTSSNIYAEGVVVDQRPVPYEKVPQGTAMNFIVSSGPSGSSNR
jgi:eukaryotic-like serine/threonine-protein kinase